MARRKRTPGAFGLLELKLPNPDKSKKKKPKTTPTFSFRINRAKFRANYRREGRYLLRSNLSEQAPATLWDYTQLTEVEEAFKNLKRDLGNKSLDKQTK